MFFGLIYTKKFLTFRIPDYQLSNKSFTLFNPSNSSNLHTPILLVPYNVRTYPVSPIRNLFSTLNSFHIVAIIVLIVRPIHGKHTKKEFGTLSIPVAPNFFN